MFTKVFFWIEVFSLNEASLDSFTLRWISGCKVGQGFDNLVVILHKLPVVTREPGERLELLYVLRFWPSF